MPALYRAYEIALLLTAVIAVGFAFVLWTKARNAAGAKPLIAFVLGSALGSLGWVSLALFGPAVALPAHLAIATAPAAAACFVHFAFAFTRDRAVRLLEAPVIAAYALGGLVTPIAWVRGVGPIRPWLEFEAYYYLDWYGWVIVGATALLAGLGHLRLFIDWWSARPIRRRQLVAACVSALWGFVTSAGFLFPNFGIQVFPLPVLLLPFFLVILVYGVLRYQVMDVNLWARRTLTWLLLMTASGLALGIAAALPAAVGFIGDATSFWRAWLFGSIAVLFAAVLLAPLRQLADRLIFPGGQVSETEIARWRAALAEAPDRAQLASVAEGLIRAQLRAEIAVRFGAQAQGSGPELDCLQQDGQWRCVMRGWDDAPPGPRYVAQIFGGVLAEAASRLQIAEEARAREGERRQQAHLAELGVLAATVAHDLRNPLNIIAMAVAGSDGETRGEVATQLGRMNNLISDLLDYSSAWKVERRTLSLRDEVDSAVLEQRGAAVEIDIDPALRVAADPRRLRRVFANLLVNARAASGAAGRILVAARREGGHIIVDVCDNGSGVAREIRSRLFEPFVSRSAEGTGLGLAIAARIMDAHGGSIALAERAGWSTCFSLQFPVITEAALS